MSQHPKAARTELSKFHRPLEDLCCVEPDCSSRGARGAGNLRFVTGKGGGQWRIVRCATCRTEFSERKGTPLWGTRMPPEKAEAIAKCLKEVCGIRGTARIVGASKDGVTSIAIRLGRHARSLHDQLVTGLNVKEVQFDEKWAFVGKKQKHCDDSVADDADKGDQWDHTAVDADSRMVVSIVIGKRTQEAIRDVVQDFAERTGGAPPP